MNNDKSNNTPKGPEYRCPKCNRFLYDRRRKKCMWCNAELPEELLFTKEEIEQFDKESAKLEEERRQRKIREEKKKEEKKRNDGGGFMPFFG